MFVDVGSLFDAISPYDVVLVLSDRVSRDSETSVPFVPMIVWLVELVAPD